MLKDNWTPLLSRNITHYLNRLDLLSNLYVPEGSLRAYYDPEDKKIRIFSIRFEGFEVTTLDFYDSKYIDLFRRSGGLDFAVCAQTLHLEAFFAETSFLGIHFYSARHVYYTSKQQRESRNCFDSGEYLNLQMDSPADKAMIEFYFAELIP